MCLNVRSKVRYVPIFGKALAIIKVRNILARRDPGFETPLLPFRRLDIIILSMTPQFTQLFK